MNRRGFLQSIGLFAISLGLIKNDYVFASVNEGSQKSDCCKFNKKQIMITTLDDKNYIFEDYNFHHNLITREIWNENMTRSYIPTKIDVEIELFNLSSNNNPKIKCGQVVKINIDNTDLSNFHEGHKRYLNFNYIVSNIANDNSRVILKIFDYEK